MCAYAAFGSVIISVGVLQGKLQRIHDCAQMSPFQYCEVHVCMTLRAEPDSWGDPHW